MRVIFDAAASERTDRTSRLDCDRRSGDELLLRLLRLDLDDVTDIVAGDFGGLCINCHVLKLPQESIFIHTKTDHKNIIVPQISYQTG